MFRSRDLVFGIGLFLAAVVAGCGAPSEADRVVEAQERGEPLPAEERLIERRLVTDSDVAKSREGSAERAFLEYWSAISFEDWSTAVRYFDRKLRTVLNPGHLVQALKIEGRNNVPIKPLIRGVRRTRGSVTIRYFVRTGDGRLRPTSSSWEQRDGVWYLVYSATLDDSYGAAVQQAVQYDVDPTGTKAAKQAITAGYRNQRLQAETLAPTPTATPARTPSGGGGE